MGTKPNQTVCRHVVRVTKTDEMHSERLLSVIELLER